MICYPHSFELSINVVTCRLLGLRLAYSLQRQPCCYGSKAGLRQQADRGRL